MQTENKTKNNKIGYIKKLNYTYHDSQGWEVHKDVEDYAY